MDFSRNMLESKKGQKFVSKEIGHLIHDKQYPFKRAVAAALNVARSKGYDVGKKKEESVNFLQKILSERKLSYAAKQSLPKSEFVFPKERRYPIPDEAHAKNALARVSAFGTPEEKAKVIAAVKKSYPGMDVELKAKKHESTMEKLSAIVENLVKIRKAVISGK